MIQHVAAATAQGVMVGLAAVVTLIAGAAVERRAAARRRAIIRRRVVRVTVRPDRAIQTRAHYTGPWWQR